MTRADDAGTGDPPFARTDREREIHRAWFEPMTVNRLDGRRWVVEDTGDDGHVVTLDRGECTCPAHGRGVSPCRHVRRVAMAINGGRYSPPELATGERSRGRGGDPGGDRSRPRNRPRPPGDRGIRPGSVVFDRERPAGPPMLVVGVTGDRADEVPVPGDGRPVADYGHNRRYSPADPVVEVVYPGAVRDGREPRRYSFPLSRLETRDDDTVQTVLPGTGPAP